MSQPIGYKGGLAKKYTSSMPNNNISAPATFSTPRNSRENFALIAVKSGEQNR